MAIPSVRVGPFATDRKPPQPVRATCTQAGLEACRHQVSWRTAATRPPRPTPSYMTLRVPHLATLCLALLVIAASFAARPLDAHANFFAPTSVWNKPLAANAPLDPNSAAYVRDLVREATPRTAGGYGAG